MDRDILLKVFEAGSMPLTLEEIEMIMDEEMAKDPSEMDGDLVEACLEILTKATQENKTGAAENREAEKTADVKGKKRIKLRRMLIFAAIIAVLLAASIPVCGKYIRSDASNDIVRFAADHFEIDLSAENNDAVNYSDESVDIIKALNDKGIENVILPAELLKEEYVKTISNVNGNSNYLFLEISFENKSKNIKGKVSIIDHQKENTEFIIGQANASGDYDSVKQLSLNGIEILVFNDSKKSHIIYVDNDMEYEIYLHDCDFESAVEIAKTLE